MVPFQCPSYDKLTKDGCLCVLHIVHIFIFWKHTEKDSAHLRQPPSYSWFSQPATCLEKQSFPDLLKHSGFISSSCVHRNTCTCMQKGNTNEKPIKVDHFMQFNMKISG